MGRGEWPKEVELVGTWFMFAARFNQLVWVTFRVFFLVFLGQKLMWERDCFGNVVIVLVISCSFGT